MKHLKQLILGANGIIGEGLAKELREHYTDTITLFGRHPQQVNNDDTLFKGNLLHFEDVDKALSGTAIVYLTVGLPYDSQVWMNQWPQIMTNVIKGCKKHGCKLVYFDNTYAYPQNNHFQIESMPLRPNGKKGQAKRIVTELVIKAIENKDIQAVICRAPEFYGPGKTKGITNTLIFDKLKSDKKPIILLNGHVKRTLIYTPDASKAMALIGNSNDTYGQIWHLPCDDNRFTYNEIIHEISNQLERPITSTVLTHFMINLIAVFNKNLKETKELLPRYAINNIFDSSKFKRKFPEFKVTPYAKGIRQILENYNIK